MKNKKILFILLTAFISTFLNAQQPTSTSVPTVDTKPTSPPEDSKQETEQASSKPVTRQPLPTEVKREVDSKQEKWCQYLIANQIYIAMSSNLTNLIMESAEKVRDEATADKNMLWVARANFSLGIYAFQYRRIGLAEQYWKKAVETYKQSKPQSSTETSTLNKEKELANLALAQLHALVPTSNAEEMKAATNEMVRLKKNYERDKNIPIPLLVQIFEVNLNQKTFEKPEPNNDLSKQPIDLVRTLGFHAIKLRSEQPEQANCWMERVIGWYYDNKVKSPEIHAFEVWYDEFPQRRFLHKITLKDTSDWNFSRSSDKEGNYYGYVPDTLDKETNSLSLKKKVGEQERIKIIYEGLIHPEDAGKWMILHLNESENKAYSYAQSKVSKAKDKLSPEYQTINYNDNDNVELSQINFRDKELLISGNMASAVAILSKPFNIHSAILPVPDMRDFKNRIKELYKQLDINWVLNNPNISNSTQMALLAETKNLKVLYPDEETFEKEFKKFSALVQKIQALYKSQSYKSSIQLSRRGYLGVYLGLGLRNPSIEITNAKSLGWWLTLLKDDWAIANSNSIE